MSMWLKIWCHFAMNKNFKLRKLNVFFLFCPIVVSLRSCMKETYRLLLFMWITKFVLFEYLLTFCGSSWSLQLYYFYLFLFYSYSNTSYYVHFLDAKVEKEDLKTNGIRYIQNFLPSYILVMFKLSFFFYFF